MGKMEREVSHEGTLGTGIIRFIHPAASGSFRYGKKFKRSIHKSSYANFQILKFINQNEFIHSTHLGRFAEASRHRNRAIKPHKISSIEERQNRSRSRHGC